jgi:hypothetical protein
VVVGRPLSSPCFGQWQIRQSYLIELRRILPQCSIRYRSQLFHLGIGGERAGAIDVLEIDPWPFFWAILPTKAPSVD